MDQDIRERLRHGVERRGNDRDSSTVEFVRAMSAGHRTATRFRHAAQGCRALASAPLGSACPNTPIPFPDRNAVSSGGEAWAQGRSGDGTPVGFVIGRGSWVARFPGEHSLSLGTPGLHDESPLGLIATTGLSAFR